MARRTTVHLSESSAALPASVIAEVDTQGGDALPAASPRTRKAKSPAAAQRQPRTSSPKTTLRPSAAVERTAAPAPSRALKSAATAVRAARSDSTVGKIQANLEQLFKLPAGSVQLKAPRGKKVDEASTIGELRALWVEAEEKASRKKRPS